MWNPSGALISKSGFKDINEYFDKLEQWKSVTGLRLSRFGVCDFLVLLILDCLDLECQLGYLSYTVSIPFRKIYLIFVTSLDVRQITVLGV